MNPQTPNQSNQSVTQKGNRSYAWYFLPIIATLIFGVLTQLVTNHICRNIAPSNRGECIPGLWFFPAVMIEFIGFWAGIILAITGTVRFIKSRR